MNVFFSRNEKSFGNQNFFQHIQRDSIEKEESLNKFYSYLNSTMLTTLNLLNPFFLDLKEQ